MAMSTEPLTAERILVATEEVLRRHGPAKATVVDVARQLGVSHGSVYRHFRTKAALREAVTERWLNRSTDLLREIASRQDLESAVVLRLWLSELFLAKMHKAGDDPELFGTYEVLLRENSRVVEEHIAELVAQLTVIVRFGVERGSSGFPMLRGRRRARCSTRRGASMIRCMRRSGRGRRSGTISGRWWTCW